MRELSLNILDIAQNSVAAGANNIAVTVNVQDNLLKITVEDDGKGMTQEFLAQVTDPFTTTRTTRKVGMGLPLLQQEAQKSGGEFAIKSQQGLGTKVEASFEIDHIDRLPLGDLAETLVSLVITNPKIDFILHYAIEDRQFEFDTKQVKKILDGVPIESYEIIAYIRELLTENIIEVNGGISL